MDSSIAARVAVITPYCDEPIEYLRQCYNSVRKQDVPTEHIFVGDGPDVPPLDFDQARCYRLSVRTADYGETPRRIGWQLAARENLLAVAYLDADNWFHPDHLRSLLRLHEITAAAICTSRRTIHQLDGRLLGYCGNSDGERFCDTNCIMFFPPAFHWLSFSQTIERALKPIHDRVLWSAIKSSGVKTAHSGSYTAAYRSKFRPHYELCGVPTPLGLHVNSANLEIALRRWAEMGNEPLSFLHEITPATQD